jgi:hypothetical protein
MEKHIIQVAQRETATDFVKKFSWNAAGNFIGFGQRIGSSIHNWQKRS